MNYILQSTKDPVTNTPTCYYRFVSTGLITPDPTETNVIKLIAPIYINTANFPPDTPTRYLMSLPGVPYYDGAFISGGGYEWTVKRLRSATWTTFSLVAQSTTLGTNQAKIFSSTSENGMKIELHNGSVTTGDFIYIDGYFVNTGLTANEFLSYNTIYGQKAGRSNTTGDDNSFFGKNSGYENTTGNNNSFFGDWSGQANTTGDDNSFFGKDSGLVNTTGIDNSFFGKSSGNKTTTGNYNSFFGQNSGQANTTGSKNSFFGDLAGSNHWTGDNIACIGYNAQASTSTAANEITLGDANITSFRCQVELTVLSDERDKTEIKELKEGLAFIEKINPKTFHFDKRDWYDNGIPNGMMKEEKMSVGIIAQDLLEFDNLNIVNTNNPEKLEVTTAKLIFPLINAVKELSQQVKELQIEIRELKKC